MSDYKELVERLRHECAAFGDHSYDGCECSNEELLASAITDLQGKLKAAHDAKQAALDIATVARQDLSRLKDLLAEAGKLQSREKWLRAAADEIAKAGHNGWGNTCLETADAIAVFMEKIKDATER